MPSSTEDAPSTPQEPTLPTREELSKLYQPALVAYAARCAWRVMPLLVGDGRVLARDGQEARLMRAVERANACTTAFALGLLDYPPKKDDDVMVAISEAAEVCDTADLAARGVVNAARLAYESTWQTPGISCAFDAAWAAACADDDASAPDDNINPAVPSERMIEVIRADLRWLDEHRDEQGDEVIGLLRQRIWPGGQEPKDWGRWMQQFHVALTASGCADVAARYRALYEGTLQFSTKWLDAVEMRSARIDPISIRVASDLPTTEDGLQRERWVLGLRDFLRSKQTQTPLTISIEAPWGAGKSSFMLKLRDSLPRNEFATVWFNPWRHEKNEELWAAFALSLVRQLEKNLGWWERKKAEIRYARAAMKRGALVSKVGPAVLQMVAWLTVLVVGGWAFWAGLFSGQVGEFFSGKLGGAGSLGVLAGLLGGPLAVAVAFRWLIRLADAWVGRPADIDIGRHLERPDYAARTTFLEHFHRDFRRLLRCYAGEKKVVVFVDDLDRCDVPRAAELVQGLNLLMSGAEAEVGADGKRAATEEPRLIFILGIDRAKVAAGIAVKFEKLLPYLYADRAEAGMAGQEKARMGIEFGYEYLEKFIQIPFRLPRPGLEEMAGYIDQLLQVPKSEPGPDVRPSEAPQGKEAGGTRPAPNMPKSGSPKTGAARPPAETPNEVKTKASDPDPTPKNEATPERLPAVIEIDEAWMRGPAQLAAGLFEQNPRRVKQFVALLRLTAHLLRGEQELEAATLRQLGKFLAATMRWPDLVADLEEVPELLEQVLEKGHGTPSLMAKKWRSNDMFVRFLTAKPEWEDDDEEEGDYDLRKADIGAFLRVAAVTRAEPAGAATDGKARSEASKQAE